jgi:hypothetical protein
MTFTADNESCIGFDHAGPMVSAGYEWLLRGFFCLPVGETASFETLKAFLGATRVGSPGLDRSALGTRVVPLPSKPA